MVKLGGVAWDDGLNFGLVDNRFSEIARKALVLLFPDFEYLFSELIGLFGNELVFYCGIATLD